MCEDSTLGRICKSAPTVFINYMAQAVTFVQWQYFFNSPTCPPVTRRACTNEIVHHPIHENQNQVAHSGCSYAEWYFRADMQVCSYRFRKFNGASGYVWVIAVLFQLNRRFCLRGTHGHSQFVSEHLRYRREYAYSAMRF